MTPFTCSRCGKAASQLPSPPTPNELGAKVYDSICADCWRDWLRQQTSIINHYSLNLRDPQAKEFLIKQTETFLFEAPKAGA